ncbi:MAG TPA: hypothetical protein VGI78_10670 [Acetobacteraceae bacterium]
MTLSNDEYRAVDSGGLNQRIAQCVRAGYVDARAEKGYCADYDRWSENEQLAYESGRFWVALMVAAKIRRPAWAKRYVQPPPLVSDANALALQKTGGAIPGPRLRDDAKPVALEPWSMPRRAFRRRR